MAEQDTSADADLQLKKRARRRLVGAIALALLAVIVLPMVMDREPRPVGPDIQIRIPSQDDRQLAAKVMPGKSTPVAGSRTESRRRAGAGIKARSQARAEGRRARRPSCRCGREAG
jgi:cell division septation protein DedD